MQCFYSPLYASSNLVLVAAFLHPTQQVAGKCVYPQAGGKYRYLR